MPHSRVLTALAEKFNVPNELITELSWSDASPDLNGNLTITLTAEMAPFVSVSNSVLYPETPIIVQYNDSANNIILGGFKGLYMRRPDGAVEGDGLYMFVRRTQINGLL
jgi:hypothetical protein